MSPHVLFHKRHPQNKKTCSTTLQPTSHNNTLIMLPSTFLIFLSLSLAVAARPQSSSSIHQSPRAAPQTAPPAHGQPFQSDIVSKRRLSPPPPPKPIGLVTRQFSKRFIMNADYASGSNSPVSPGKSSLKRDDPLSDMVGTATVGEQDIPPGVL
ncbi:hypothetical protein BC826DRAFT_997883 [Russula brevipes]|nr:hypothetical protein BC826DRAFT_997883 [Russula brevipes]